MTEQQPTDERDAANAIRKANRSLTLQLVLLAVGFLGFGFAMVPLYNVICDVTGYGSRENLTRKATLGDARAAEQPKSREITVEFMSTMPTVGEWEFHPVQTSVKTRTGQLTTVKFIAKNLLAKPATGQAVPSLAPHQASQFFHKTECFCFSPQHFDALQQRELTVRFFVDPQLPDDIDRLTLSYAMYGLPQKIAAGQ